MAEPIFQCFCQLHQQKCQVTNHKQVRELRTWDFLLGSYFHPSFSISPPLTRQIAVSYVSATTGAVAVSVGMNSLVKVRKRNVKQWINRTVTMVTKQ